MKKRVAICVVALMCVTLIFSITAQATGTTTYNLDELGMSIDVLDDYGVFTRETPADNPNYAQYGFTKKSMDGLLKEKNIYLNAIKPDGSQEIVVTMIDSPLEDFNQFSDTTLSMLSSMWLDMAEDTGITYIKSEIYRHKQVKFVKAYISQSFNDQPVYGLQYYTVCNGQAINITMHSYAGEITQTEETALKKMVDSADFRNAKLFSEMTTTTESFEYTDPETGLSFTIPANWRQEELSKEGEALDAMFESVQEEGLMILYGSTDAWELLTESERAGFSRHEFNNDIFSTTDIATFAEDWEVNDAKISTADYGGKTYFVIEGTSDTQVYGMTISIPMTVLMRVENGYLFQFQFMGESSSPYFNDFAQLLSSAKYPETTMDDSTYDLPATTNASLPSGDSGVGAVVICLIASVAAFIAMLAIKRNRNEKNDGKITAAKETAPLEDSKQEDALPVSLDPSNSDGPISEIDTQVVSTSKITTKSASVDGKKDDQSTIAFCHKCGTKLIPHSVFCNNCGTKIPDERGEI